jgi:hypothetical protein
MAGLPQEAERYVALLQARTYRWTPYSESSAQHRRGVHGRWQRFDGFGWENAEPAGLAWCDAPTPAQPMPPVFTAAEPADAALALRELLAIEDEGMPRESAEWEAWRKRRAAAWVRARAIAAAPTNPEPMPSPAPVVPKRLRQQAIQRALRHAVAAGAAGEHGYLPESLDQARMSGWQPHDWVVRAVVEALQDDPKE